MKTLGFCILTLISFTTYSQKEKLIGKWQIVLNTEADTGAILENDAIVKFFSNQTAIIVDHKKKYYLKWKLNNQTLSFECTKNHFPRFCNDELILKFEDDYRQVTFSEKSADKTYKLKRINNRR